MVTLCKLNKLLVIDDDKHNNYLTEYRFRKAQLPYELKFKDSIEEAIGILSQKNEYIPDLILLDLNLPILNGWDFLNWYDGRNPEHLRDVIIYILSSSVDEDEKKKAYSYPFVSGFIEKPLKLDHIKHIKERYFAE